MKLYNTLSRKIETLPSSEEKKPISFYACGPTVYDETHIGHMRKYTMDDILKRTLKYLGYDVKHVMNITDVGHLSGDDDSGEDKLEKGAKKQGKTVWDVAKYYTDKFFDMTDALNIIRPDVVPKATDHIQQMIELIKKLEEKGFTYETEEAVYFDVTKFPTYGELSGQKLADKKQAVREEVNIDANKKHPADFALWFKRVGRFADHTMHWDSKWGDGFPGWHIECSAMSMEYLGEQIDVHSGGVDHIPVHHENEIAQSEAATGVHPFVKYWVHHAFLKVNDEKMSKSKGNFFTLKDLEEHKIDPLAIRYLFLQTHYKQEMNFTWESAEAAQNALNKLRNIVAILRYKSNSENADFNQIDIKEYKKQFIEYLSEDLNTAKALAYLWEILATSISQSTKLKIIYDFDEIFGMNLKSYEPKLEEHEKEIIKLGDERQKAKSEKNYDLADKLRNEIEAKGYIIEDTTEGYKVKKK